MLEILTGLPPFAEERQDAVTVFHLLNGKRPSRPALELVPEDLWVLINQCWNDAPEQRSLIEDVANQLELLTKMGSQDDMGTDDSEDWVHIDTPRSSSAILRFDSRLFKRVASFYSATQYPLIFRKRAFASNVTSASEEDQIPCYHQDMYPSERNEVLRALSSTSRALRSSVLPALYETVDLLLSATNESTVNLSNQIFSTFSMVTKHEPQLAICIQTLNITFTPIHTLEVFREFALALPRLRNLKRLEIIACPSEHRLAFVNAISHFTLPTVRQLGLCPASESILRVLPQVVEICVALTAARYYHQCERLIEAARSSRSVQILDGIHLSFGGTQDWDWNRGFFDGAFPNLKVLHVQANEPDPILKIIPSLSSNLLKLVAELGPRNESAVEPLYDRLKAAFAGRMRLTDHFDSRYLVVKWSWRNTLAIEEGDKGEGPFHWQLKKADASDPDQKWEYLDVQCDQTRPLLVQFDRCFCR